MNGKVDFASTSEDEFPDLDVIFQRSKTIGRREKSSAQRTTTNKCESTDGIDEKANGLGKRRDGDLDVRKQEPSTAPPTVRRRKLGRQLDNPLLRPLGGLENNDEQNLLKVTVETRTSPSASVRVLRNSDRVEQPVNPRSRSVGEDSEDSTNETTEITEADISEFFGDSASESEDDDTSMPFGPEKPVLKGRRHPPRSHQEGIVNAKHRPSTLRHTLDPALSNSKLTRRQEPLQGSTNKNHRGEKTLDQNIMHSKSTVVDLTDQVTDTLRLMDLRTINNQREQEKQNQGSDSVTPPSTPPRLSNKVLTSPKKLCGIPKTPHRPSMDLFWNQEFVDEWNEEHSPKKLALPSAQKSSAKSPVKARTSRAESTKRRETKKSFEKRKHDVALAFLRELDDNITQGRLQLLAESTGGIKINWSSKLNTTAGRANWRRETVRSKLSDGTDNSVTHRHHASIELAEKVIDDENRLLNVVAHEFCHLANFMINGITGNPHGKEFKVWAAKCSQTFGDRGIEVTTKHSYEIDFKYVWECTECGLEYKRHSKSINPERHRCGSCKAQLKQTKPVPRAAAKPSEYQMFFKEQMKLVKGQYPKSPQKEVMRIIADRWAKRSVSNRATPELDQSAPIPETGVDKIGARLGNITL
ncbi:sprt family metallopeptidase [Colletotrichum truncatum]|uniref:Sprt family metallopeptidase n=1 Tax=Colletotrichum truncatum TaxID=5467 RepID=A0ACC3YXR8_COLTU|nr:sprt family metallopeptidase [Colletotrichum truncatum]KAF6791001.1 sprt family metallopeptidase [Colletotrichum truncatum]